jgi:hypothetical protein
MKNTLFIFLLFSYSFVLGQNTDINVDNYYSYNKGFRDVNVKKLTTARLSEFEIAQILKEEMKTAGFEWLNTYRIVHIDNDNYILSICYSEKSNFGFVLETTFEAIPNKENRNVKSISKKSYGYDYSEKIVDTQGKSRFVKITDLPKNLYIIKQDVYWYQTTENEEVNKTLVTKDVIKSILRKDVQSVLKTVGKG